MKLQALASKPKLEKIVLDSDDIIALYEEPLEFYMWDRQDLPTFIKLVQVKDDQLGLFNLIKDIALDENGKPVLKDGEILPMDVMVAVIQGVVDKLGNLKPQTTTTKAENSPVG
jgi:hypothetical protein